MSRLLASFHSVLSTHVLVSGLVAIAASACSGADATSVDEPSQEPASPDGSPVEPSDDGSALYVLSTRIQNPEGDTSYLIAVDSLSEQSNIDLSRSLEISGAARAYGPSGNGKVYLTSSETGSMTEVIFDADGAVTPGRVVSFTGLGVGATTGGSVNAFLSPTKAYHINQSSLDVIVWNPQTMTITGSFPTGLDIGEGQTLYFQQLPILVGERLLLVSFLGGADEITTGTTTLTVIDTASDQVISNEADSRCSQMTSFARDTQGNLYFASNWVHAANYFLFGESVPHPPCMLRIVAGETRFDPQWSRFLATDLGTPIWSGVFPGTGDQVLVQGLAEDSVGAAVEVGDLRSARPWTWYELLPEGTAQSVEAEATLEAPLSIAGYVDDEYYLTSYLQDLGTSILVQTTAGAGIRSGIEIPGQVATVIRLF